MSNERYSSYVDQRRMASRGGRCGSNVMKMRSVVARVCEREKWSE